ncbi:MAG: MBL fold metallo-hydrolase [Clostridia bacterium]|nr:MBL fold metallo-hydrolase [Clostridia bacterium]
MNGKVLFLKRAAALLLLSALCAGLAACVPPDHGITDNSGKYGAPKEFEGEPHEASVMFVNVGKADCAIVKVDGHAWLIDAGTEESFVKTYAALELMGISALDGAIITHGHGDHMGGLDPIAQKYAIGRVVTPAFLNDRSGIEAAVYENGLTEEPVRAGDSIPITEGVEFKVLAPLSLFDGDDNDNSLVVKLEVNGRSFLFTGDMQQTEDRELVKSGADVSCDVLKVPNHGNKDASSVEFANAAKPLIAVISTDTSVDENSANRLVMARYSGAEIYVTQKYPMGVRMDVSVRGEISLSFPEAPGEKHDMEITEASKLYQSFTLRNNGNEEVDISGWFVWSTKGFEVFVFPENTVIKAGAELTVACKKSSRAASADLIWDIKKVWADNKADSAVLCDAFGNELARTTSR